MKKVVLVVIAPFGLIIGLMLLLVLCCGGGDGNSVQAGTSTVNGTTVANRQRVNPVTPLPYQTDFINKMKEYAALAKSKGIYPSVMIAQASIESDWGRSGLTVQANNYFGVKASSGWSGATLDMWTWEEYGGQKVRVIAKWKVFQDISQSVADYCDFCHGKSYVDAGVLTSTNYCEQITALKNGGYATDSTYIDLICTRVEEYNLDAWDSQ